MSNLAKIFQNYGAAISRDQRVEKLLRALQPFLFDGTECHRVVNAELRGVENEIAASNIRHAIVSQYRNTAPLEIVIEIVAGLLERGELRVMDRASRDKGNRLEPREAENSRSSGIASGVPDK